MPPTSTEPLFVGIASADYGRLVLADRESLDAYATTGNSYCVASNRISYFFDWKGPSISLDAACASSLAPKPLAN